MQIERKGLPDKAPELWIDRDKSLREDVPQFIRRVYEPWLGKGLTRTDMRRLDKRLASEITDWLVPQGRVWPEDVDLPSMQEWRTRAIHTLNTEPSLIEDSALVRRLRTIEKERELSAASEHLR
ncbi:MAG: hypothetical protein K2X09_07715 [Rickettsiales bacterium]|nr:hypothetical protein [Rickettsiales bacterium]